MRVLFLFVVLFFGFFATITALVRPDIVKQKFEEIKNPIDQYQNNKDAELWRTAKTQEHAAFMLTHPLPSKCSEVQTEVRKMECRNIKDQTESQFEISWQNRITQGWKP